MPGMKLIPPGPRRGKAAGRGAVTKLLSAGEHTSSLVDPICTLLGLDPPVAEVNDPDEFALLDGFRRMTVDARHRENLCRSAV